MRIIDRLDIYIREKGINDNQVTVNANLSVGLLNNARKGGSDIGKKAIEKILSYYQDLNRVWLITGEGNMLVSKTVEPDRTFSLRTDHSVGLQDIPLYNFEATAGLVSLFNDHCAVPVDFLKIPNLPSVDGAIFVRGESMYPLLKSGDIVIYKMKEISLESIIWGEIYLLSFISDGDTYTAVKYIQKSEDPEKVKLVSFNQAYAPKDIHIASITALALVKASITFHTME